MRVIDLPLHTGRAPHWLLSRMRKLAKPIVEIIIDEFGEEGFLERISDPIFFQAFSNVLGFDWNSSGSTTVLVGVLKSVLNTEEFDVKVAGGKGKSALKTPEEIISLGGDESLVRVSRLTAKIDNALLQDGYDIYAHAIFFSKRHWTVVQQGMNTGLRMARRYHWRVMSREPEVEEPHSGIVAVRREREVINLTSKRSGDVREAILDIVRDGEFKRFELPRRIDWKALERAYELQPERFEDLLLVRGLGKEAIRALVLIADLIYNVRYDRTDPAKYCFAVGGKDGVPFPVNRRIYDEVIEFMRSVVEQARLGNYEKMKILKRLSNVLRCENG